MYKFIYWLNILLQDKIQESSLIIRVYRRAAEKALMVYFIVNPFKPKLPQEAGESPAIVSLTSFPDRIDKVWLVVESILYQTKKPRRIVLWLYKGEFDSKASLPKRLLALEKRGLEIRFCDENLMPHLKYYYTMKENPSSNIITVDDDMFYPPNLIETLYAKHQEYPDAILSVATREIKFVNNEIWGYKEWPKVTGNAPPGYKYLNMGVGGAFYPANCLHEEIFNLNNIKHMSLKADDLWLKVMSLLKRTKVRSLAGDFPYYYLMVYHENTRKLEDVNVGSGNNDKVFKKLVSEYNIDLTEFI